MAEPCPWPECGPGEWSARGSCPCQPRPGPAADPRSFQPLRAARGSARPGSRARWRLASGQADARGRGRKYAGRAGRPGNRPGNLMSRRRDTWNICSTKRAGLKPLRDPREVSGRELLACRIVDPPSQTEPEGAETLMAEETSSGGGNSGLAFIVGGLVVIVAVLAFFMMSGGFTQKKKVDVDISAS